VTVLAVGFARVNCARTVATQDVFSACDWFEVSRIYAGAITTEVIQIESGWDRTN